MNKQETFELIKQKITTTDEELNDLYAGFEEEYKSKGLDGEKLEKTVCTRLKMYFKKQWASPAVKFNGIIIGATDITDFGAKKNYEFAIEQFKKDPSKAVVDGLVNGEGQPLYVLPEWKKGQRIDLERDKGRTLIMLAKQETDSDYKRAFLNLTYDHFDLALPMFTPIEFRANISKKSTDFEYLLNGATVTEFKPTGDIINNVGEIKEHLVRCFKDNLVSLPQIVNWHEENKETINRFAIVKANVMRISLTKEGVHSNLIEIDDPDMDFDPEQPNTVTCWVPKEFDINFSEGTMDLIVIGRTNINDETGQVSMNCYGFFCDKEWQITEKPKEIKEENQTEEDW